MVSAPPPPRSGAASLSARPGGERLAASTPSWPAWLLLGLCFGLGYGLTHRLLDLRPGEVGLGGHQSFSVKAFPGTSLDELRRRHRDGSHSLRADLDAVEAERQKRQENEELKRRQAELEQRDQAERERRAREDERLRLEELQRPLEPAADPSLDTPPPSDSLDVPPPPSANGADSTLRP